MTPDRAFRLAVALTCICALAIAYGTLTPVEALALDPPGSDKLHHFLAFGGLVFPLVLVRPRVALWLVPVAALYGGAIELIQPHVGRHGEWADALANTAGAVIGAGLAAALHPALPRRWRVG